jgi:hypothetical protein
MAKNFSKIHNLIDKIYELNMDMDIDMDIDIDTESNSDLSKIYRSIKDAEQDVLLANKFSSDIDNIRYNTRSRVKALTPNLYLNKLESIYGKSQYFHYLNVRNKELANYVSPNLGKFMDDPINNYNIELDNNNTYYKSLLKYQTSILKLLDVNYKETSSDNSVVNNDIAIRRAIHNLDTRINDEFLVNSQSAQIINNLLSSNSKNSAETRKEIDKLNTIIAKLQMLILNSEIDGTSSTNKKMLSKIIDLERENKILREINTEYRLSIKSRVDSPLKMDDYDIIDNAMLATE